MEYDKVQEYLLSQIPEREAELIAMEAYAKETNFPIIGPAAGNLCYLAARMIGARKIFELGSGYGYSTAWFARAVKENGGGKVYHVVWDKKLSEKARNHLTALGYQELMEYHVAEAVETLRNTPGPFDLLFNDIDKEGYPQSIPVIKDKLRSGGIYICDNTLWDGKVLGDKDKSESTKGIIEMTKMLKNDPDWITSLLPIRDGLIMAMKK